MLAGVTKPCSASIPARASASAAGRKLLCRRSSSKLRARFDFHLVLVPDPDGYGASLRPLADAVLRPLTVPELVDVLGRVDLLLCNDSGPGHIAAACGRPAIPIFGPTDPDWFRPWGDQHHLVIRDICPWRPCFDYCKFSEPYCMTKLLPERAWPEIRDHVGVLIARGVLPRALERSSAVHRAMNLSVAALVATYQRPRELARLLDSLAKIRARARDGDRRG